MMKMKRLLVVTIFILCFVESARFVMAGDALESAMRRVQQQEKESIATRNKVLTIGVIATLLGVPLIYLTNLIRQYAQEYGLPTVIVALRYNIPFQPAYLKIMQNAATHNDQALQNALSSLKATIGQNDQERFALMNDFITMDQRAFNEKYGVLIGKQMLYLLKTYAAAADLYFRKLDSRTYMRTIPAVKNQAKAMEELNQALQGTVQ